MAPFTGEHCQDRLDLCKIYNPCKNGAKCNVSKIDNSYSCTCNESWKGKYCDQYKSICETNPCGEHGRCYETKLKEYSCFCNRGYTGRNCEKIIDPCLSSPCRHNSTCFKLPNSDYECQCSEGYKNVPELGLKRCEVEINPCDSIPCLNGGICFNSFNYYNCSCPPDFTGINCENAKNPCKDYNCNNGTCVQKYGLPVCECELPYYGSLCQFEYDFCESMPCQNAGQCINVNKKKDF